MPWSLTNVSAPPVYSTVTRTASQNCELIRRQFVDVGEIVHETLFDQLIDQRFAQTADDLHLAFAQGEGGQGTGDDRRQAGGVHRTVNGEEWGM